MRVLLVHNPKAGDEEHSPERLESLLRGAGHDVVYRSIEQDEWKDDLETALELVAIAGGDGTVCEVLGTLAARPVPATILPLGSANNISRTLGYPSDDAQRLIDGWPTASRSHYDIWTVSSLGDTRFVESMGGGMFADVLVRADDADDDSLDKVELGLRVLGEVLESTPERSWEVSLDGVSVEEPILALEAMNIRELGPNIPLAPEAEPGDGLLDVVLVRAKHRAALSAYVRVRLAHGRAEPPTFDVRRARNVSFRAPDNARLRLDDEVVPESELARKEIDCCHAARLELLVPHVA